jgi:argininosuccinate lyase
MNQWKQYKTKRKRGISFKTSHEEIESAVSEYLKNGGKITKLEANDSNYISYLNGREPFLVDEFLSGR